MGLEREASTRRSGEEEEDRDVEKMPVQEEEERGSWRNNEEEEAPFGVYSNTATHRRRHRHWQLPLCYYVSYHDVYLRSDTASAASQSGAFSVEPALINPSERNEPDVQNLRPPNCPSAKPPIGSDTNFCSFLPI